MSDFNINIVHGKNHGFLLRVNGLFICDDYPRGVKAIKCENGVPYGATEWITVRAIRCFWEDHMNAIIHSTTMPYKSEWGNLIKL